MSLDVAQGIERRLQAMEKRVSSLEARAASMDAKLNVLILMGTGILIMALGKFII